MLSKFLKAHPGLYVQPRMGMASLKDMKRGIKAVKDLEAPTIGTITLDSYTRLGQSKEARKALEAGLALNGFPILLYKPQEIIEYISYLADSDFLIQVRHGTPIPEKIFQHLVDCNLFLTEGGPISYCLPYSRASLKGAISSWQKACDILARHPEKSHLESFGGCLLGQLCHPSILVSVGILEALFFLKQGLKDISLSYAQQYSLPQDLAAVSALTRLAGEYLSEDVNWHIVIYTFMGLFPQTYQGYEKILEESIHLARLSGAKRLIVKTYEESVQIPSVSSNLKALEQAHNFTDIFFEKELTDEAEEEVIYTQAKAIIDAVLNLDKEISTGIYMAFQQGYLDVPFCIHPDNRRLATCAIDQKGYLQWVTLGNLPFQTKSSANPANLPTLTSQNFLEMLQFNRNRFDKPYLNCY